MGTFRTRDASSGVGCPLTEILVITLQLTSDVVLTISPGLLSGWDCVIENTIQVRQYADRAGLARIPAYGAAGGTQLVFGWGTRKLIAG
jgi:hypothetical protein